MNTKAAVGSLLAIVIALTTTATRSAHAQCLELATDGDIVYAGFANRLVAYDISVPSAPGGIGTLNVPGDVTGIAISGNYAYLAAGSGGLRVVDISNPSAMTELTNVETIGHSYDIAVGVSPFLYLADGTEGLRIFDITSPASPVKVTGHPAGAEIRGVTVWNQYVYIADGSAGLVILDVAGQGAPTVAGSYDTPGQAHAVAAYGTLALVADGAGGLRIIDVSTPAAPTEITSVPAIASVVDVIGAGGYAYYADGSEFRVADLRSFQESASIGGIDLGSAVHDVELAAGYRLVANDLNGFRIVSVTLPTNQLVGRGSMTTPDDAYDVRVSGELAYIAAASAGLRIADVSDPDNPVEIGSYDTDGSALGVDVAGDFAFVADGDDGLKIVDVSTPTAPFEVGAAATSSPAKAVAVAGTRAYVATRSLHAFNVGNVTNPTLIYEGPTQWVNPHGVTVDGQYVYHSYGALRIFDTSAPAPYPNVQYSGSAYAATVSGRYAYLAALWNGVIVVDVSNPMSPSWVGGWDPYQAQYGDTRNTAVRGNVIWACQSEFGLRAVSWVFRSSQPLVLSAFDTPGLANDVDVQGDLAYVADLAGGVHIVQLNSFCTFDIVGTGLATGIRDALPSGATFVRNYPNPFNPETTISFRLGRPGHVTIAVYDVRGRWLRTLADRWFGPGFQSVQWDGRDAQGTPASSGVYFYQLRTGSTLLTKKMVLVK